MMNYTLRFILGLSCISIILSVFISISKNNFSSDKPYNIICIEGVQHFQTGNETRPVVTVAGRFRGCE